MLDQFFGKSFRATFAALAGAFVVSAVVFPFPVASGIALVLVGIVTTIVSWKRPELGLTLAFAELFANSHGHLISYVVGGFSVSVRMAVFGGVMLAWLASIVTKRSRFTVNDTRFTMFLPLFAAVILGFVVGFLQNSPVTAFKDGNAYLYLAYLLPILSVEWDGQKKRLLLQVFAASAAWVGTMTIGLLYVFTHFPEWMLGPVYTFVRDTRTGELTKMSGALFRIFLQAQFSVVAFAYFLLPFLMRKNLDRRLFWKLTGLFALVAAVILISLSRSFWVGILVGGFVSVALVAYASWPGIRSVGKAAGSLALATAGAGVLLVAVVLFPFPYQVGRVGDLTSLFSSRTTDLSDVAISSRWNLLPPLVDEVKSSPVLGSGFGEEVTFETDDPRARAINPDGTWTTYALEWGWLEIWLKMGILGPLAFLYAFYGLIRGFWGGLKTDQAWVSVAFISAVVMLYATHVFSPYLNHPLGLGLLMLAVPFLKPKPPAMKPEAVAVEPLVGMSQVSVASLIVE